jgi:hypothetical protein
MIAHGPTPVQQQRGWVRPDTDLPTTSRAELAAARWLGLALAVAVAAGADLIVAILKPSVWPLDATGSIALYAGGVVPVLAAAPFGWLLGPVAARARRFGGASIVVGMAVGVMILGDVLTVIVIGLGSVLESGTSYPSGDIAAGLVAMSVVGGMVVGPFVVVLLTLPASVAWIVAFWIAWPAVRPETSD